MDWILKRTDLILKPKCFLPVIICPPYSHQTKISASLYLLPFPQEKYVQPAQFNFSSFFLLTASSTAISFASGYAFWNSPALSQNHKNQCQLLLLSLSLC